MVAGGELGRQELTGVRAVGGEHQEPGVAAAQELVVEPTALDDDVGESPTVLIARLDVAFELHHPAGQMPRGEPGCLGTEALDTLRGMVRLRRVDTEQPHGVNATVLERHDDRVTVDHLDDAGLRRRAVPRLTEPPSTRGRRGDHRKRHDGAPRDHGTCDLLCGLR